MRRFECLVCGRKFYEGQGVVFTVNQKMYAFHSKSCALKFLRRVLEEIDDSILAKVFEDVKKEFESELREKLERRSKRIA